MVIEIAFIMGSLAALAAFALFHEKRRAVIFTYLLFVLFMPEYSFTLPIITDLNKHSIASYVAALGVLIFDRERILRFNFHWMDIPVIIWLLLPIPSGLLMGLSPTFILGKLDEPLVLWTIPYFMGRLYIDSWPAFKDLAKMFIIGGLMYVPFCLFEARMSPQLHTMVYGYHQHDFVQARRMGGWRPTVFMQHGLAVSLWMATTTVALYWCYRARSIDRIFGLPTSLLLIVMIITTLLCRSFGAMILLAGGIAFFEFLRIIPSRSIIVLVLLLAPGYASLRAVGWDAQELLDTVEMINSNRVASLRFRVRNEKAIVLRAQERPILGWGPGGHFRDLTRAQRAPLEGRGLTIESGWIFAFGKFGFVGLFALLGMYLLPPLMLGFAFPVKHWTHGDGATVGGLAMVMFMYSGDNLVNQMLNANIMVVAGGLASVYVIYSRQKKSMQLTNYTPGSVPYRPQLQHLSSQPQS